MLQVHVFVCQIYHLFSHLRQHYNHHTWHRLSFFSYSVFPCDECTDVSYFQFSQLKAMKRDFIKRGFQSRCLLSITSLESFSERIRVLFMKSNHANSSQLWEWSTCNNLSTALYSLFPSDDFHTNLNIWLSFFLSFFLSFILSSAWLSLQPKP